MGYITKMAPDGTLIWSRDYGTNLTSQWGTVMDSQFFTVTEAPNGNYIAAGRAEMEGLKTGSMVTEIDAATGNLNWTYLNGNISNTTSATFEDVRSVHADTGGIYICGEGPEDYPSGRLTVTVTKLDLSGNFLWRKSYGIENNTIGGVFNLQMRFARMRPTADHGFLISAMTVRASGFGTYFPVLIKIDRNGVVQWAKEYAPPPPLDAAPWSWGLQNSIEMANGDILACGTLRNNTTNERDLVLYRFDPDGDVKNVERIAINGDSYVTTALGLDHAAGGGFLYNGKSGTSFGQSHGFVMKLDGQLNFAWARQYRGSAGTSTSSPYTVQTDSALYSIFHEGLGQVTSLTNAYLVKSDLTGYAGGCEEYELNITRTPTSLTASDITELLVIEENSNNVPATQITDVGYTRTSTEVCVDDTLPLPVVNDTTICAGESVTLPVVAPTPLTDWTFDWYADSTSAAVSLNTGPTFTVSPTSTTTYWVGITRNSDGETHTERTPVTVYVETAPSTPIPLATPIIACPGELPYFAVSQPNPPDAQAYQWYAQPTGGPLLGVGTTFTPGPGTPLPATYYVEAVAGECKNPTRTAVEVIPEDTGRIDPIGPLCETDAPVPITTSQPGALVSGDGVVFISGQPHFDPGAPGVSPFSVNEIYMLAISPNGCDNIRDTIEIEVDIPPTATITTTFSGPYCSGDPVVALTGFPTDGEFTISGGGLSSPQAITEFDPSLYAAGTYDITLTATNGCGSDTDVEPVVINPGGTATIDQTGPFCDTDADVTLSGTPAGGTFTINGSSATVFSPQTLGVGSYTVEYTVNTSCGVATESITIDVISTPTAAITGLNADYCTGDAAVMLTGTPAGGDFTIDGTPATTFDPAALGAGSYLVEYTVTASCGTDVASQTVTVNSTPTASIDNLDPSYCTTDAAVTLAGTSAGGDFTIDGTPATTFDPAALGATSSPYLVEYTVTNTCGTATDDLSVAVISTPTAAITGLNADYCIGDAAVTLTGTPAGGDFTIDGTPATAFDPATLGAGSYLVEYTVTASCGSDVASQTVTVNSTPTASIDNLDPSYCTTDAAVTLAGTPAGGDFTIDGHASNQL